MAARARALPGTPCSGSESPDKLLPKSTAQSVVLAFYSVITETQIRRLRCFDLVSFYTSTFRFRINHLIPGNCFLNSAKWDMNPAE